MISTHGRDRNEVPRQRRAFLIARGILFLSILWRAADAWQYEDLIRSAFNDHPYLYSFFWIRIFLPWMELTLALFILLGLRSSWPVWMLAFCLLVSIFLMLPVTAAVPLSHSPWMMGLMLAVLLLIMIWGARIRSASEEED